MVSFNAVVSESEIRNSQLGNESSVMSESDKKRQNTDESCHHNK